MTVSLEDQIKCVRREIGMRERVYARRVADRAMTQEAADKELGAMKAVLDTLTGIQEAAADRPLMTEPTREELIEALKVLWFAHSSKTTRDALSYIGLGIDSCFPAMKTPINSVSAAREVLARACPDLKRLDPIDLPLVRN